MPHPDSRGNYMLDMTARLGLLVLNVGNSTTFRRPGYAETIPDVSFASDTLTPRVENWRVIEDYTGSDHQYITFIINDGLQEHRQPPARLRRWNVEQLDEQRFEEALSGETDIAVGPAVTMGRAEVERLVASTMTLVTAACRASMPVRAPRFRRRSVYWWTPEIAGLRRRCLQLRRAAQRARHREEANVRSAEHREAKKTLRYAINRSKRDCWRKLGEDLNSDPWGQGYKLVVQRLGAMKKPVTLEAGVMRNIVSALFPIHPARPEAGIAWVNECPPFSEEELEVAVSSLKNRRAPGPDEIPGEALKMVLQHSPHLLLDMYNACLAAGVFPSRWKISRLVLISKKQGDPEDPSSYRPLCMLDTAGKALEKLIRTRLQTAVEAAGNLSPHQYGFRRGRSTVDAILEVSEAVRRAESHNHFSRRVVLLVTLDVRNAFNSASWRDILHALEHSFRIPGYLLRIFDDYLRDRSLVYETESGRRTATVTSGVAQGSILGPDLWNILYDDLLRMEMPDEVNLVGYADDIAALIAARDVEFAQIKLNQVMRTVSDWMEEHGLSLALQKTEIVVLTKKRIDTIVPLRVGAKEIVSKPAVKYLGVMIDSKMSFWPQIESTADKAATRASALERLMANVGGPSSSRRRLLMTTVQSMLLYGAEVWADALGKEMYRKRLARVQRRTALRVASAYRTVSEPAILVVVGIVPIALMARERKRVFLRRREGGGINDAKEERSRTMEAWQTAWEEDERGRWTARLIRQVQPWTDRRHGEIDYYLTQFFTAHGYFRSYLNKMGKVASDECLYCPGIRDDAHHTFFQCGHWAPQRRDLEAVIGNITADNIVDRILRKEEYWNRFSLYIRYVLRAKKADLDSEPE